MARVDPDDDSLLRYVVLHYRYDPLRRERRNLAVCAFDNPDEMERYINEHSMDLRARKRQGLVDEREHYSGVQLPPGYREEQRRKRRNESTSSVTARRVSHDNGGGDKSPT